MTEVKRIVCLASSIKKGGLCVAGKEINDGAIGDWIRPIGDRPSEAVLSQEWQKNDGSDLHVMDIVDIPLIGHQPNQFQPENWLFDAQSQWMDAGGFDSNNLMHLVDPIEPLWHNGSNSNHGTNNRMRSAITNTIPNSLRFVFVDNLTIIVSTVHTNRRVDGIFRHDGADYRLSVTDPQYRQEYRTRRDGIYEFGGCYLTVSVGELFDDGYHYKLIAAIIPREVQP